MLGTAAQPVAQRLHYRRLRSVPLVCCRLSSKGPPLLLGETLFTCAAALLASRRLCCPSAHAADLAPAAAPLPPAALLPPAAPHARRLPLLQQAGRMGPAAPGGGGSALGLAISTPGSITPSHTLQRLVPKRDLMTRQSERWRLRSVGRGSHHNQDQPQLARAGYLI